MPTPSESEREPDLARCGALHFNAVERHELALEGARCIEDMHDLPLAEVELLEERRHAAVVS